MQSDFLTLPCGCNIWTEETPGGPAFCMEPCSLDCTYLKYAMEQAKLTGKEIQTVDLR